MLYEVSTIRYDSYEMKSYSHRSDDSDNTLLDNITKLYDRITSYNVCYTKLLRFVRNFIPRHQDAIALFTPPAYTSPELVELGEAKAFSTFNYHGGGIGYIYVITSYSIHYTKLYDV